MSRLLIYKKQGDGTMKQTYKVVIYLDSDRDPKDWLPEALDMNIIDARIFGHDVEPIDKENPTYKWIKDLD
jgi:endo-1,4-beta-mannosidase